MTAIPPPTKQSSVSSMSSHDSVPGPKVNPTGRDITEEHPTNRTPGEPPETTVEVDIKGDNPDEPPIVVRTSQDSPGASKKTASDAFGDRSAASPSSGGSLPTNPATSPGEQRRALLREDPKVIAREMEKGKAEERALAGERPKGTEVDGIEDTELWALQRRFDSNINHVLHPARDLPPNEPDLRQTNLPNVPFRSDTLKSNFERLVASLGPPSVRGFREVLRITDWYNERDRTAMYCASYFIAWVLGYTVVACGAFFVVLVCFPETRRYLFPAPKPPRHTPPSATDPTNTRGDESLLGSVDGKVKHRTRAEQAEEQAFEARAITEAYAQTILLGGRRTHKGNAKVGRKDHHATAVGEPDTNAITDDTGEVIGWRQPENEDQQGLQSADAMIGDEKIHVKEGKNLKKVEEQEAKRKRDELVAKMAKGTETGLGSAADMIEILQNAMSPPIPYPDHFARFKIAAALIVPPVLAIHFIPAWLWGRLVTFSFGAALWGTPIARRIIIWLEPRLNWKKILDPRNSLLSGTPTNAQLLLHIMRVSEELDNPLPPPPAPPLKGSPKEAIADASPVETEETKSTTVHPDDNAAEKAAKKAAVKSKHHVTNAFKKLSRKFAGMRGDVAVDGKQKQIGPKFNQMLVERKFGENSPDAYACKLNDKAGHFLVDESEGRVGWVSATSSEIDEQYLWNVDDIVELQKAAVSLPRLTLGWIGGAGVESLGLTIRFSPHAIPPESSKTVTADTVAAREDTIVQLTSVHRRDPLFNRLIAVGPQRWEVL